MEVAVCLLIVVVVIPVLYWFGYKAGPDELTPVSPDEYMSRTLWALIQTGLMLCVWAATVDPMTALQKAQPWLWTAVNSAGVTIALTPVIRWSAWSQRYERLQAAKVAKTERR